MGIPRDRRKNSSRKLHEVNYCSEGHQKHINWTNINQPVCETASMNTVKSLLQMLRDAAVLQTMCEAAELSFAPSANLLQTASHIKVWIYGHFSLNYK